jgi:hypothetical protein
MLEIVGAIRGRMAGRVLTAVDRLPSTLWFGGVDRRGAGCKRSGA